MDESDLDDEMADLGSVDKDEPIYGTDSHPENGTIIKMNKIFGKYQIINTAKSKPEVAFIGTTKKKAKKIAIPSTISYQGITYQVTEISANALKNCKKLQIVTVGSNIVKIEKNAFKGCNSLKSIAIKSRKIIYVGKNAFKNISKSCRIKVPTSKLAAYRKLFYGK